MSYPDPNPFAASAVPSPVPPPSKSPGRIEFMRAYNYVFENPNWAMNILWGFLCIFSTAIIPILGQLVFMGYQFEVIDSLLATRGTRHPNFDINRFTEYLTRSIWPFLVNLAASLILVPIMCIVIGIPVVILASLAAAVGEDAAPVVLLIGIPLMVLILLPLSILLGMILVPMIFRAGMTRDFFEGFNSAWVTDYVKKVWWELFLAMLFLVATAFVLSIVGLLLCYLPVFAAAALIMLAQAHLMYQLYLLYLDRGGQPIPVKAIPPTPLPPPLGSPPGALPPGYPPPQP